MITERNDDVYVRYLIAGVSEVEILLSHVIWNSLLMFIKTFMVFNVSFFVFNVPCIGDLTLVMWLLLLTGFCGLSFGTIYNSFLLNVSSSNKNTVLFLLVIILMSPKKEKTAIRRVEDLIKLLSF